MNLEILNTDDRRLSDEELRYIVEIMAHPKVLAFEPDYRNQQDVDSLFREALKSSRDPERVGRHVSLIATIDDRPVGFLGILRPGATLAMWGWRFTLTTGDKGSGRSC